MKQRISWNNVIIELWLYHHMCSTRQMVLTIHKMSMFTMIMPTMTMFLIQSTLRRPSKTYILWLIQHIIQVINYISMMSTMNSIKCHKMAWVQTNQAVWTQNIAPIWQEKTSTIHHAKFFMRKWFHLNIISESKVEFLVAIVYRSNSKQYIEFTRKYYQWREWNFERKWWEW